MIKLDNHVTRLPISFKFQPNVSTSFQYQDRWNHPRTLATGSCIFQNEHARQSNRSVESKDCKLRIWYSQCYEESQNKWRCYIAFISVCFTKRCRWTRNNMNGSLFTKSGSWKHWQLKIYLETDEQLEINLTWCVSFLPLGRYQFFLKSETILRIRQQSKGNDNKQMNSSGSITKANVVSFIVMCVEQESAKFWVVS